MAPRASAWFTPIGTPLPPDPQPASVPCPGCGRAYAASRLGGGRSRACACGARVGIPLEAHAPADPPRFLCDSMLGGLARRLRTLGYDAAWHPEIADDALVAEGVRERRWILTRDRALVAEWWLDSLLLLRAAHPHAQLLEVAARLPLSDAGLFTRCSRCNDPLRPLAPAQAEGRAPDEVVRRGHPLAECPACRRVYWEGSHTARMRDGLRALLGEADE